MVPADNHDDWRHLKRTLTRELFAERFAHPFLIARRPSRDAVPSRADDGDYTDKVKFVTQVEETAPGVTRRVVAGALEGARVIAIVKALENPYPERISLGRAQNCDLVVREPSVSKLHLHFVQVAASSAQVVDARSANKTRVNAAVLEPQRPHPLTAGDTLIIGTVVCQFVDARSLYDLL